jgi:hypothetical protein
MITVGRQGWILNELVVARLKVLSSSLYGETKENFNQDIRFPCEI